MTAERTDAVWQSGQRVLTVLLGLPGIVISVAAAGVFVSALVDEPGKYLAAVLTVGMLIIVSRVVLWRYSVGERHARFSADELSVERRGKVLESVRFEDIERVHLDDARPLWKVWDDFVGGGTDFAVITVSRRGTWQDDLSMPGLLAMTKQDASSLRDFLASNCAERGIEFS